MCFNNTHGNIISVLVPVPCSGGIASVPADMLQSDTPAQQYDHCKLKPDDTSSLTDVTVYEIVSVNVWPSSTTTATILQNPVNNGTADNDNSISFPRKRKIKRPFSPEIHAGGKRLIEKRKGVRKQKGLQTTEVTNIPDVGPNGKPFSCEKCHSPFIVNPARIHRLDPRRKYRPRKITDVVTKQVLLLCNACGLSMSRSRKERHKKEPPTQEEKDAYLKKAAEFAASLAASLQDLDACRLYCPAFKSSACRCLQKYISADGRSEEGSNERALHLLALLKEARQLTKQKIASQTIEINTEPGARSETENEGKQRPQVPRGLKKRRSKEYEEFVLKNRQYLREELHLCERASQRVLMYSNNFLHKKLKTSPSRGCRVDRVNGKNARGLLKPVSQLANETCCSDRCVTMVLTHSKLLETWRARVKLGQREARRVLAEMLTPSGGSKANCYKFISMVTGCSYATICLVSDQMRRTQGEREPPDHGLKKWWRDHPTDNKKKEKQKVCNKSSKVDNSDEDDPQALSDIASIQLPDREDLDSLSPQEVSSHLQKLLDIQKQLLAQQAQVQQHLKEVRLKMNKAQQVHSAESAKNMGTDAADGAGVVTQTGDQQVLRVLELPTPPPSVITENIHPQPSISVMTSTGDFEPLTAISVRGQTTFSNIVILPESALAAGSAAQGTSVISYSPPTEAAETMIPGISSQDLQSGATVESMPFATKSNSTAVNTFQLYGVMDTTTPNLLHFNY
ncbi:uncharacterized protein LOC110840210 isoform X3 [Zootermopsis nevadensis]|uniref:uncharacterized protein LOC110840210 isoform X3 n=1 Tax=Zootermopsis nevadensis TaxID=136037 RepID=UPI000B8E4BDA|nr:uncharacterized protein LOC110840210 isoform X3 [Zootermopsis nevadensis]